MKQEWRNYIYKNLPKTLLDVVPKDISTYVSGYELMNESERREFWTTLLVELARYESGFKPTTTYKEDFKNSKGEYVLSVGLFQMSTESAKGYGVKITNDELKDPFKNIDCMLVIANRWITKDRMIASDSKPWKALSRYWSPFRKESRKSAMKKVTMKLSKGEKVEEVNLVKNGRQLNKVMIQYFDNKLSKNPIYIDAVKRKDARLIFGLSMEACVGIQEATGRNDGKMVEAIQDTVGNASGEPWCMALVQTCIANAERVTGIESPVYVSELCYSVWHKTPKKQRVKYHPLYGAIAIWNDKGTTRGHTEMVRSADNKNFQAIGGNTSGSTGTVNRDGNACVYTVRPMKTIGKRQLLGFLKPF
jgi:hypothetical protein